MKTASGSFQRRFTAFVLSFAAIPSASGATASQGVIATRPVRGDAVGAGALGAPPNYSWQWATIGAPGNRPSNPQEMYQEPERALGAVGYAYRMATTEVTIGQWFEFVRAYAPYVGSDFGKLAFTGEGIIFTGFSNGVPQYTMNPANANIATDCGWRYAARFVNWHHNNKALTREAFESGAYETSTFGAVPNAVPGGPQYTDQAYHSPGAKYWIPSVDEWVKAAYYDPNRYGPGQDGYWRYPNSQNEPLVGGRPGEPGAQTGGPLTGPGDPIPVGSYMNVNLPWGLFDLSGGENEWTEGYSPFGNPNDHREIRGSYNGHGAFSYLYDRIDTHQVGWPSSGRAGLRMASAVPGVSTGTIFVLCGGLALQRRRPCVAFTSFPSSPPC